MTSDFAQVGCFYNFIKSHEIHPTVLLAMGHPMSIPTTERIIGQRVTPTLSGPAPSNHQPRNLGEIDLTEVDAPDNCDCDMHIDLTVMSESDPDELVFLCHKSTTKKKRIEEEETGRREEAVGRTRRKSYNSVSSTRSPGRESNAMNNLRQVFVSSFWYLRESTLI